MGLFLELFFHLPLPNQVFLAFTCKELFSIFGSVLEAKEFEITQGRSND